MTSLCLSALQHTWIIDIDGTMVKHNGHKNGGDTLLQGVLEFWSRIPRDDVIILLSAREQSYAASIVNFLKLNGIRYDHLILGMPKGERILINDIKPSGLKTAFAVNVDRDYGLGECFVTCEN